MKLSILTENNKLFIVGVTNGEYVIEDASIQYLREQVLGKRCRQPKELFPLEIYFSFEETLQTSRIKRIREL